MHNPEEYTVLHIGLDDQNAPQETTAQKTRLKIFQKPKLFSVFVLMMIGSLLVSLLYVNSNLNSKLERSENYIASLIDEVGGLKQDRFLITEQMNSQDMVLKTIEEDFNKISDKIGTKSDGGEDFSSMLAQVSSHFEQGEGNKLVLADTSFDTQNIEDGTYDVLLIGTNGALTDTIMVASVNDAKKKIVLNSIPRDLYMNGRRINEYFTYYGVDQLERMVEVVTGLHVDNYAQVDLNGFVEIVDIMGGIDVTVEKAIYDGLYPNKKGGYDPYSIQPGEHHMSGEEALKYARSRKSTSDFDRAARQQLIVKSAREQLSELDVVMDLKSLTKMFQAMMANSKTDVDLFDAIGYYHDYKDYQVETGIVLTSSNYLYSLINEAGAYILLPKGGNFDEIHKVISSLVN
ncbi:LCP family protein [Patescibacteria group bacterium]|nr:LCP family protein [Patescibacteria group bacterium]